MTRGAKVTLRTMKDAMDQATQEYSSGLSYLVAATDRSIPTVMRHIAELTASGCIERTVKGGHKKNARYKLL